jgi:hypothetical protein
MDQKT